MRMVFFGASKLGYNCCRFIIENNLADVVGIFTMPRQFDISYADKPVTNILHADFHTLGEEFNIPVVEVSGKMNEYQKQLADLRPDFICVIGWYYMIPTALRNLAPKGCAGIHASLLPKYRGGAPLVWAIINGEKTTGVTFFHFADGVDNGDIIAQKAFEFDDDATIADLVIKAEQASLAILRECLPRIAAGTAPRLQQNEADATYFPQRSPEDGLIDWTWDAKRIKDFIRAQTKPYPGAFTFIGGKKVTIWDADIM